ncbi:hypothetical protein HHI36_012341 [Cryptolaemus montrouzieri]|uniref:Uncharacterized protein n=1 Tax=Cryptolaemus montrouzieri TaxID=559131 RepID=A0ABD2NEX7_9CUCU
MQESLKIDNLEFRRSVVISLLQKFGKKSQLPGPPRQSVSVSARSSGQHLIMLGQQRRRTVCNDKTTKRYKSCSIPLQDECFSEYHGFFFIPIALKFTLFFLKVKCNAQWVVNDPVLRTN